MNYVGNKWLNLPWKGRLATKHYAQACNRPGSTNNYVG